MKKLAIAAAILSILTISTQANADSQTITAGYAYGKVQDLKNLNGINIKYRYEWDSPFSIIGSFTYMSGDSDYSYYLGRDYIKNDVDMKYYSFSAGPAYRINQYISIYGLLGVNYNKADYKTHWYNYEGRENLVDMGTENGSQSKSSFMYGAGIQINPLDYLAIDIGYEGSSFDDGRKSHSINGFNINVGYRF